MAESNDLPTQFEIALAAELADVQVRVRRPTKNHKKLRRQIPIVGYWPRRVELLR
jgi:hypothetical protein